MPQRWNSSIMQARGESLFKKAYRKKRLSHANHDIHFLSRSLEVWLPKTVNSLVNGTYCPQDLKRHYFEDDTVDSLHLTDRIAQNILLHEIKPTFSSVMSKHCYHLHGPHGVKLASDKVRLTLEKEEPQYLIRADIKSYYASIPHYALLNDIKKHYADTKLLGMLERIVHNGIEVFRGTRNPDKGIALRGPLSQFFSAMYLKPLDDAFENMTGVTYLRFQDDILIFCKTKRQFQRCQRRLREVLRERRLRLSRKKSKQGRVDKGFHFLGVNYPALEENTPDLKGTGTQPHANTTDVTVMSQKVPQDFLDVQSYPPPPLAQGMGGCSAPSLSSVVQWPHPRTLRNAREQVRFMTQSGLSALKIQTYLRQWATWWVRTVEGWSYDQLLSQFIHACYEHNLPAAIVAEGLRLRHAQKVAMHYAKLNAVML